jgi:hypothetical protein
MKYKLLKDLPYAKAGEVFERVTYISKDGLSDYDYLKIGKRLKDGEDEVMFTIDCDDFLGNFDEWFEKIEPTDSIHWKPKKGEKYWNSRLDGDVAYLIWSGYPNDYNYYDLGRIYRTEEECEKARDRELAEARLRRTSTFKPNFKSKNGGWAIGYNYHLKELVYAEVGYVDYGEIVRYATEEEAEKSIKENREDWLIYFGVKE